MKRWALNPIEYHLVYRVYRHLVCRRFVIYYEEQAQILAVGVYGNDDPYRVQIGWIWKEVPKHILNAKYLEK